MNDATDKQFPPVPVAESYDATVTVWCAFHINAEPKKIKLAEAKISHSASDSAATGMNFQGIISEHLQLYSIYYENYPDGEITIEVHQEVTV
jgi:hypothetical protein